MTVTNYLTGEVLELADSTPEEIIESMLYVQQTIKLWDAAYTKLKRKAEKDVEDGFEHNGYKFRYSHIQRMTYDMNSLRQVFDEDELATFMTLRKTAVDDYIKEHVDELGAQATLLRRTMIPEGAGYTTVRLERLA